MRSSGAASASDRSAGATTPRTAEGKHARLSEPVSSTGEGLEPPPRLLLGRLDGDRGIDQDEGGVGEHDPATDGLEQPDARLALQLADLLAHRGGRVAELARRGRHRAVAVDGAEEDEPGQVDHVATLTSRADEMRAGPYLSRCR